MFSPTHSLWRTTDWHEMLPVTHKVREKAEPLTNTLTFWVQSWDFLLEDRRRERVVQKEQLNFSDWVLTLKTATNLWVTDSKARTGSISFKEKSLHSLVQYYFKVWLFLFEKQDWQMLFLSWIHFEVFPLFSSNSSFNQRACCWETQGSHGSCYSGVAAVGHLL